MAVGNLPGNVTAADVQTLVIYSMQILTGVLSVAMCINFISMSKGSMERICEVLAEQPTITAPADPVTCVRDGSVDFCHVSFAYSARSSEPVLRDIDLHIDSGEMIGIIGATGSGKSSLVSLIPRLYDVSGGSVRVRRGERSGLRPGCAARQRGHGAAEKRVVLRFHCGKPAVGQ